MKNILIILLIVISCSGCASYASYKSSETEILRERFIIANVDEEDVSIRVNILATDAIIKHPFRQSGAAILDAALAYGVYQGIENLNDNSTRNYIYNNNCVINIQNNKPKEDTDE